MILDERCDRQIQENRILGGQAQVGSRPWNQAWWAKPQGQQAQGARLQGASMQGKGVDGRALGMASLVGSKSGRGQKPGVFNPGGGPWVAEPLGGQSWG